MNRPFLGLKTRIYLAKNGVKIRKIKGPLDNLEIHVHKLFVLRMKTGKCGWWMVAQRTTANRYLTSL